MATKTTNVREKCSMCDEEDTIYTCKACTKNFCHPHVNVHHEKIKDDMNPIVDECNSFRQNLIDLKDNRRTHFLIEQINQWERNSNKLINQTAEQLRERLTKYLYRSLNDKDRKLNQLNAQIEDIEKKNKFNENHIHQFNRKLKQLQRELNRSLNVSIKQQSTALINKISLVYNTTWKQNGITIAGGNDEGYQLNQLCYPSSLCIDDEQTVYIADYANNRIVAWKSNATHGEIVAGGNGGGSQTNQLNGPRNVIIDKQMNSLIISDHENRRVMRWSLKNNTDHGYILVPNIDCYGLAMDKYGDLYIADWKNNAVRKWKRGDEHGTIVAGGNGQGGELNQLDYPTYIFVDENDSLYISDTRNHRVMKWIKGATEGIIVAGGNGRGDSLTQLSEPQGVTVDQSGQVYVVDADTDRVMCWCEEDTEGTIIIGGSEHEERANHLYSPRSITLDREGNLYVVDEMNHRIQKFETD